MAANDAKTNEKADELRAELETLKEDLAKLRKDLSAIPETGRDLAGDSVAAARESLQQEAEKLMDRMRSAADEAGAQGKEVVDEVGRSVSERPVTSLLVAFGTGLALGWMTQRSK